MPIAKDLTGQRFGYWTVISKAPNHITKGGNSFTTWNCRCDCGNENIVFTNSLLNGRSQSCGCKHSETQKLVAKNNFETHAQSKTRLYKIWAGMKKRCNNPNASNYKDYGGRGITVCEDWNNDFTKFKMWADNAGYSDNMSIDRIDVNDNYYPDNCRWVDCKTQGNNKRNNVYFTLNGKTKTIAEWSEYYNIPYKRLHKRLSKGIKLEDAIY